MKELILWGTRKGAEEWEEELLLSNATQAQIDKVKPLAMADGFDRFRVSEIDLSAMPDFIGAITA